MAVIDRNSIRIVFAILVSMLIHAALLSMGSGKALPPRATAVHRKVTVRLVARKAPAKPVLQPASRPAKKAAKAASLQIPEPVAVVVQETPSLVIPAAPVVPARVTGVVEEAPEAQTAPEPQDEKEESGTGSVVLARPLYKENPPPEYPAMARRRQLQGTVLLEVAVSRVGKVEDLELVESSGHKILDRAALRAVRSWLFEPGRKDGRQVAMKVLVPVRFSLR